jgi:hypothetical protein
MSIIPLHLERRFEQLWAARFDFAGNLGPYRRAPDWGSPLNLRQKAKKTRQGGSDDG